MANIVDRNNARITEIKQEILPFKRVVQETNLAFKNIVEKLDIAETERESVSDSLKLLEARYKRGRLPSREVYERLLTQSLRRQAKIDRTIDRLIQSLRGYLI